MWDMKNLKPPSKFYKSNLDLLQILIIIVYEVVNVSSDMFDEILQVPKDFHDHLKNPLFLKTNDVCWKTKLGFTKVFKNLRELKALF